MVESSNLKRFVLPKPGKRINVSLSISPIKDATGEIVGCSGIARDITERKRAEEALRISEERLRLAAQAGKMFAYEWDVATDVVVRSGNIGAVLGPTSDEPLTRQQILARVHPADRTLFIASVTETTPENPNVQITYRMLGADGSVVWLEKTAHAFFDGQGRVVRMIGMVADITERKLAEDSIKESEMRYRRIVETTNEGVWLLDSTLHNAYVNRQMAKMLGYEPGDMVGRSVFDFYFPEDAEDKKKVLMRRKQGVREEREERLRRSDGSELWVRLAATPVTKGNGEFDGALAMMSDITERKRAEEALHESEERLRLAAQIGRMFAYSWDAATDVIERSGESAEILGVQKREAATGVTVSAMVHPDDKGRLEAAMAKLSLDNPMLHITYRILRPDGAVAWLERNSRAYFDGNGKVKRMVGMVVDVTERKRANEALAEMTRKLIAAQEQERARIGRELHDDINQRLAMVAVELERLQEHPSGDHSSVQALREEVAEISNDVQALSHDLHSSKLEYLGVVGGMKSWCKEFAERQRIEIDFKNEVSITIPSEIGHTLFRVLQEAMHNVIKHSGVKRVDLQLWGNSAEIHLLVTDLGRGFDVEAAFQGRGLGLWSMRERVRLVNGTIAIESKPMGGTTIDVRVPLESQQSSQRAS